MSNRFDMITAIMLIDYFVYVPQFYSNLNWNDLESSITVNLKFDYLILNYLLTYLINSNNFLSSNKRNLIKKMLCNILENNYLYISKHLLELLIYAAKVIKKNSR